jgi:RNA polymerase sigma-B factor
VTIELLKEYQQNPTVALRNKIVEANGGLVHHVAKKFRERQDYEDLVQVAFIELVRCVEKFDITKGYRFSSYAETCIYGSMLHYLRDKTRDVKPPRKYVNMVSAARKFSSLSDEEIALELNVTLAEWRDAKKMCRPTKSLDTSMYEDGATIGEMLTDGYDPYDYVLKEERREYAHQLLDTLTERQKETLELLYITGLTKNQVAVRMDITPRAVQLNKARAFKKLRSA